MKHFKKTLLIAMSLILLLLFPLSVSAQSKLSPRWDYMLLITGGVSIDSWGKATVNAACSANPAYIDEMRVTLKLQKLDNTWKTVKSWSITENDALASLERSTGVYKNYSYRIEITAKAYSNNVLKETVVQAYDYGYYH